MNNLILLALPEEAPELAQYANVFFTGVGKVNAAMTTAQLIERYKPTQIINFGTAGGITVSCGLHQVTQFVQRDMQCVELGSLPGQTPLDDTAVVLKLGNGLVCSTGDNFVTDPVLELPADLVDMESYAMAKVCYKNNIDFVCYKFISDRADDSASTNWETMISAGQSYYIAKLKELNISLL